MIFPLNARLCVNPLFCPSGYRGIASQSRLLVLLDRYLAYLSGRNYFVFCSSTPSKITRTDWLSRVGGVIAYSLPGAKVYYHHYSCCVFQSFSPLATPAGQGILSLRTCSRRATSISLNSSQECWSAHTIMWCVRSVQAYARHDRQ